MKISYLEILNFRNIEQIGIHLAPGINIFCGENGSGKTSLLEAIHYFALGRSFRTRQLSRIIRYDTTGFSIFSQLCPSLGGMIPVGVQREQNSAHYTIRIAGKTASSFVEIAKLLPLQLINADSHQLLNLGPLIRRQLLDWGVFHVEPSFYFYWHKASRLLKQRNASLKSAAIITELSPWDEEFLKCAAWLDIHRQKYLLEYIPLCQQLFSLLLPSFSFQLDYYPGWDCRKPLPEILQRSFLRDKQLGYTQHGPHRCDLKLKLDKQLAAEILSQGQQKLAAYALRLAQGMLLQKQTGKGCLFLIDDLPSELDSYNRKRLIEVLNSFETQAVLTGIDADSFLGLFPASTTKMFHVERGVLLR